MSTTVSTHYNFFTMQNNHKVQLEGVLVLQGDNYAQPRSKGIVCKYARENNKDKIKFPDIYV